MPNDNKHTVTLGAGPGMLQAEHNPLALPVSFWLQGWMPASRASYLVVGTHTAEACAWQPPRPGQLPLPSHAYRKADMGRGLISQPFPPLIHKIGQCRVTRVQSCLTQ